MDVAKVLKNIKLPAVYYREGKSCYYDTYRKKLIEITPEETVRQGLIVIRYYLVLQGAENGVTKMVTPFFCVQG